MEEYRNHGLITNTLIASASDALTRPIETSLCHFLDLCSLMESCTLLDEIQVIPSSDSLPDSGLVETLRRSGVLTELVPTLSRQDLLRAVLGLPEELFRRLNFSTEDSLIDVSELPAFQRDYDNLIARGVDMSERRLNQVGAYEAINYSVDLDGLMAQIDQIATYPSLDSTSPRTRIFRSNAYLVFAAVNGLDYFPDFERAPFTAGIVRSLYRSLPTQVYEQVSKAFDEPCGGGELVHEWRVKGTVPIPPISSIVLNRADSLADIPATLLEVRNEFETFRSHFRSFKKNLYTADTISERQLIVNKYKRLLEIASGPHNEFVTLTEMLNLGEQFVKIGAAPSLPTSYTQALILQPLEWIRRWWLRRPLAVLFRMDSKMPKISEYRRLIEKHWGDCVDDELLEKYVKHALDIRRLLEQE